MKQNPFFSIIIPTLNEERYLPLLLKDLQNQTNNSFEVIHIDGKSDDKTVKKALSFKEKLNIKTKVVDVRNVSFQRNAGISLAKGDWIIFMDADNRLEPHFLDGIKYGLAKNLETDLFTTWIYVNGGESINKPFERTINLGLELFNLIGREWSIGAMIGIKREIAEDFKFDENQKFGEDAIFVKSLIKEGHVFKIFRDPRYNYSLRRLKSEGKLKFARSGAKIILNYLQGKDFVNDDFGYEMNGGAYYDENRSTFSFSSLPIYIKNLPKKQYQQAKKLFKYLTEIGL